MSLQFRVGGLYEIVLAKNSHRANIPALQKDALLFRSGEGPVAASFSVE